MSAPDWNPITGPIPTPIAPLAGIAGVLVCRNCGDRTAISAPVPPGVVGDLAAQLAEVRALAQTRGEVGKRALRERDEARADVARLTKAITRYVDAAFAAMDGPSAHTACERVKAWNALAASVGYERSASTQRGTVANDA